MTRSGRLVAGIVLGAAGVLMWVLSSVQAHHEPRSYNAGGPPPGYVGVTAGKTYTIDLPGGAGAARAAGVDPASLRCTAYDRRGGQDPLDVVAESNSKAVNQLASFTAPSSGDVQIRCDGLGPVYVDDADGQFDLAGTLLLLAALALAVGVPLLLSGLATAIGGTDRGRGRKASAHSSAAHSSAAHAGPATPTPPLSG